MFNLNRKTDILWMWHNNLQEMLSDICSIQSELQGRYYDLEQNDIDVKKEKAFLYKIDSVLKKIDEDFKESTQLLEKIK